MCPLEEASCYCPALGSCSYHNFTISLNGLIENKTHIGNHNREYLFTVEIMNEARLEIISHTTILVDDSPPEVGVVIDGPEGSPDRDFQSELLLQWHWKGFLDHESDVHKYHFAVADTCLDSHLLHQLHIGQNISLDEFDNVTIFSSDETTETSTSFEASNSGYYRLSVIAYNQAIDHSKAVCSSGITIDITPPILKHIMLSGARTQASIACSENNSIWHVSSDLIARPITPMPACMTHCSDDIDIKHLVSDVIIDRNGSIILPPEKESSDLCKLLPTYSPQQNIFLPTDNLNLRWQFEEPESQMYDFYTAISSNLENKLEPDIIGYTSTHNRTYFKCVHCGLGEGDRYVLAFGYY